MVSDFQRSNWAKADFAPLPGDTHIQFESTAPAEPPANLAILRVGGRAAGAQGAAQLDVQVANYTPTARKVAVDVSLGDAACRVTGTCPPGRATTLGTEIAARRLGWQAGEARLVGVDDALAADNVYPFVLHVRPQPTYLLLTRQAAGRKATSSLFLECALAPTARKGRQPCGESATPRVVRLDPAALETSTLASGDLIVLDHPGQLRDETVKLLATLLRRGRPIVYVAAETVDATNLKRLSEAAGSGLQMPVEFTPPPAGQTRRNLFLTSVRRESPLFGIFGDNLTATIGRLRFAGGLGSRRLTTGVDADVLAVYNDGSAAIVSTSSDAGALAVINADLGTANLPRTSAFVPLLAELVDQMLQRDRGENTVFCGEPLVAHLPAEGGSAAGLRIRGPDGKEADAGRYGELVNEAVGVVWRWTAPGPPGVYRVERDGKAVFALAVTIADEESQLDSLPADVLTARLAAGRTAAYRAAADENRRRDDDWKWFAVACVACVLGELGALLAFRA